MHPLVPAKASRVRHIAAQRDSLPVCRHYRENPQYIAIRQRRRQPGRVHRELHRLADLSLRCPFQRNARVRCDCAGISRVIQKIGNRLAFTQLVDPRISYAACNRYLWTHGRNVQYIFRQQPHVLRFVAVNQ